MVFSKRLDEGELGAGGGHRSFRGRLISRFQASLCSKEMFHCIKPALTTDNIETEAEFVHFGPVNQTDSTTAAEHGGHFAVQ